MWRRVSRYQRCFRKALINAHPVQKIAIAAFATMVFVFAMLVDARSSEATCNPETIEPGIVTNLIAWIVAKTGWTVQEPPSICFVSLGQLRKIYQGDGGASNEVRIGGIYSSDIHKIFLLNNWNANDLRDRSALLHELVHHLQRLNYVKTACLAANEAEAYHLQLEWLRERGIQDPYTFLDINEFAILLISQCRD